MGGVELAPPGRSGTDRAEPICGGAASVRVPRWNAGAARPLGDVVVLMPPLTITSPELHRIVHVLGESLDEVCES
jgi:4-aminobutyrate aminotransferase-like enzyme